jgi:hypothetical protein
MLHGDSGGVHAGKMSQTGRGKNKPVRNITTDRWAIFVKCRKTQHVSMMYMIQMILALGSSLSKRRLKERFHLYEVGFLWYINLGGLRLNMAMLVEGVNLTKKILVYYRGLDGKGV